VALRTPRGHPRPHHGVQVWPLRRPADACGLKGVIPLLYQHSMDDYTCPISMDLMVDPVLADDGHMYDFQSLTKWFSTTTAPIIKSPKTNEPMSKSCVRPWGFHKAYKDWAEASGHPAPVPADPYRLLNQILKTCRASMWTLETFGVTWRFPTTSLHMVLSVREFVTVYVSCTSLEEVFARLTLPMLKDMAARNGAGHLVPRCTTKLKAVRLSDHYTHLCVPRA